MKIKMLTLKNLMNTFIDKCNKLILILITIDY